MVSNVLVNGKPFFGEDGKIAIENLPAELIKKVQISDYKTKEEKITGSASTSDAKTINLTIDEDKNKGLFGKAVAGGGTDGRYESSLLFNYFNKDLKVSLLASSNNINSTGFSTNEIFDNMSGGRNTFYSTSSDGSISVGGMDFGGGNGITKTNLIGLNYADSWGKKTKNQMSYLYNEIGNQNKNTSSSKKSLFEDLFSISPFSFTVSLHPLFKLLVMPLLNLGLIIKVDNESICTSKSSEKTCFTVLDLLSDSELVINLLSGNRFSILDVFLF